MLPMQPTSGNEGASLIQWIGREEQESKRISGQHDLGRSLGGTERLTFDR